MCLAWARLLSDQIQDVWDDAAEPARNAARALAVLQGSSSLMQALQLCARWEGNVVALVESGVCDVLIRLLEASLEAEEGLLEQGAAAQTLDFFETLLSMGTWCDALAGSPQLFLLFTLPVREALPHNALFCLRCARLIKSSVVGWGPAVMASLVDADWMGFVLIRIDSEYTQVSPQCAAVVAATIYEVIHKSCSGDGAMYTAFSGEPLLSLSLLLTNDRAQRSGSLAFDAFAMGWRR